MLSRQQRNLMRKNGFTDAELGNFNEALRNRPQELDLNEPAWVDVMMKRRIWVQAQVAAGMSMGDIHHRVNTWLWQQKERNPIFSMLRAEYARIMGRKIKDFQRAYARKDRQVRDSLYRKKSSRKRTYESVRGRE